MRFTTAMGQRLCKRWKQAVRVSLTLVLLSSVAVVGFTLLGSKVLAAWKAPGDAEKTVVARGAFEGLFNFEAPAATVARYQAQKQEAEQSMAQAFNDSLLAKRWKFTQNPIVDAFQLAWTLYFESIFLRSFVDAIDSNPLVPAQFKVALNNLETTFLSLANSLEAFANSFLPPGLRPPPIPPVSPVS